ncbi:2329_t:CDS:1 [Scutellospora calospora]|uniref:2329_t:CDS:1 n=1 Tax=Scutellospora calospora TaxID=85575 RepID=A0ACA9M0A0_9GLOM|nr:2329_t:CDS:1 [Scutellospora calospora]
MGRLFESYKFGINTNGVPYDLQVEIERASCGHPASFMILLRLFSDNLPTIGQWKKALHENLSKYINGTHITLKNEIDNMNTHERKYIRSLTEYMADRWEIDLNNLTDLDKKLLDIGILYLVDSNSVAFTSYIILRVCIDALFPSPSRPIPKKEVPDNPVDLLALGLSWINPTIVTDKRVQNKVGISERIMQASLFCVFNGILPRPMMCLLEMKGEGRTRLDLMIVDGDKNLVAYSLKCNKISSNDFEKPIDQAQMYAGHFDMGISLVNFFLSGHKPPSVLDNITEEIFIINIEYNSACTQFTITLQSDPDYSKVVDIKS